MDNKRVKMRVKAEKKTCQSETRLCQTLEQSQTGQKLNKITRRIRMYILTRKNEIEKQNEKQNEKQ